MSSLEQLKLTFFDECSELLQQMEVSLTEMRDGNTSDDIINAVFRAVHSVKGGAGIFGFDALVGFAHVFETVLDTMRNGKLAPSTEVIDIMLASGDVLTDLVNMARAGEEAPANYGQDSRSQLQALLGEDGYDDDGPAPADFEGLDFQPVRIEDFDEAGDAPPPSEAPKLWRIEFRPKPEMLEKANEPLLIIRGLQRLGELDFTAETGGIPPLHELRPTRPYVGWSGTLRTGASKAEIEDVFEFVAGDCELTIALDGAPEPVPAMPEPRPEPIPAPMAAPAQPTAASLPPVSPMVSAPPIVPAQAPAEPMKPAAAGASAASGESKGEAKGAAAKGGATTTRVELERIDRVVNLVGELVISQAMMGQIVQGLPEAVSGQLWQILDEVVHHTRELKDSVMSMRAQPVGAVFQRMPRLVRELAVKTGKKVRLEMHGETTEVDRSIIERLADPLTHIIRNSADHGIEMPADRIAAGKPEEGTIRLSADHRGSRIVIEIRDDGAGVNSDKVLKKARERSLVSPDANLTEDEINNLIFLPGFSTADQISDISGRGVGMDVVRRNIQDIGGRISLKSERGKGMVIQLALPLTLAVMEGMVIKVGRETFVMPMSVILECLRPGEAEMHNLVGTSGMLQLRGELVSLVHLGDLLAIERAGGDQTERVVIIVDGGENTRFGVIVDELCGHQQVVIKSIEESYGAVPGVAGATILGNGKVAFILDAEKLADLAMTTSSPSGSARARRSELAPEAA
jgi:two-component system chemotaxis sensor kinase CheA